jgi:hypothetical protein
MVHSIFGESEEILFHEKRKRTYKLPPGKKESCKSLERKQNTLRESDELIQ